MTLVGLLAGRYQPYSDQHAEVTVHARRVCAKQAGVPIEEAVIAVGIRELPISWYNPFNYDTRSKMVIRSLSLWKC